LVGLLLIWWLLFADGFIRIEIRIRQVTIEARNTLQSTPDLRQYLNLTIPERIRSFNNFPYAEWFLPQDESALVNSGSKLKGSFQGWIYRFNTPMTAIDQFEWIMDVIPSQSEHAFKNSQRYVEEYDVGIGERSLLHIVYPFENYGLSLIDPDPDFLGPHTRLAQADEILVFQRCNFVSVLFVTDPEPSQSAQPIVLELGKELDEQISGIACIE
jgi:hypothetical protein